MTLAGALSTSRCSTAAQRCLRCAGKGRAGKKILSAGGLEPFKFLLPLAISVQCQFISAGIAPAPRISCHRALISRIHVFSQVVQTTGNPWLGGDDFDNKIADWIIQRVRGYPLGAAVWMQRYLSNHCFRNRCSSDARCPHRALIASPLACPRRRGSGLPKVGRPRLLTRSIRLSAVQLRVRPFVHLASRCALRYAQPHQVSRRGGCMFKNAERESDYSP